MIDVNDDREFVDEAVKAVTAINHKCKELMEVQCIVDKAYEIYQSSGMDEAQNYITRLAICGLYDICY